MNADQDRVAAFVVTSDRDLVLNALATALTRDPELHPLVADDDTIESVCDCPLCEKLRQAILATERSWPK